MDAFYNLEKPVDWRGLLVGLRALKAYDKDQPRAADPQWVRRKSVEIIEYLLPRNNFRKRRVDHIRFLLDCLRLPPDLLVPYLVNSRPGRALITRLAARP